MSSKISGVLQNFFLKVGPAVSTNYHHRLALSMSELASQGWLVLSTCAFTVAMPVTPRMRSDTPTNRVSVCVCDLELAFQWNIKLPLSYPWPGSHNLAIYYILVLCIGCQQFVSVLSLPSLLNTGFCFRNFSPYSMCGLGQ